MRQQHLLGRTLREVPSDADTASHRLMLRAGLIRQLTSGVYSFDSSREGMQASYDVMVQAYHRIFSRCGLEYRAVEADSGAMGGTDTHEFMALAAIGEDTVLHCPSCRYAANEEQAESTAPDNSLAAKDGPSSSTPGKPVPASTPGVRTIADLAAFWQMETARILKAVAYDADGEAVVVLIRGDLEVNETKVRNHLQTRVLELLPEQRITAELRSVPGFLGPVGLSGCRLLADDSVRSMRDATAGANAKDVHLQGVEPERDFQVGDYGDFRTVRPGDPCPKCAFPLEAVKGIEVGHVFQLGTKYSEKLGASFTDDEGTARPMLMGCYGIGISRTLAAAVEQHHDEHGIVWPVGIAPYAVHLITVQTNDGEQAALSERLYAKLRQNGHSVLWDDRPERPGVKFADADLLGLPVQVRVGRKAG
jgi:prolyl-tRNA synthetase